MSSSNWLELLEWSKRFAQFAMTMLSSSVVLRFLPKGEYRLQGPAGSRLQSGGRPQAMASSVRDSSQAHLMAPSLMNGSSYLSTSALNFLFCRKESRLLSVRTVLKSSKPAASAPARASSPASTCKDPTYDSQCNEGGQRMAGERKAAFAPGPWLHSSTQCCTASHGKSVLSSRSCRLHSSGAPLRARSRTR